MTLLSDLATEATDRDGNNGWTRSSVKSLPPRPDVETPDGKVAWKKSTILRWDAKRRVG